MKQRARRSGTSSGFILVIALAALAIMALLAVAILQTSTLDHTSAESAATIAREKMLADSAAALVIGQLQLASSQPGVTWISQPGLLRTYAATSSRAPLKSYKLYSAASLTDTSGNLNFLTTDVPTDWNSTADQSLFVDLNAPVSSSFAATSLYPILDPAALNSVQGLSSDSGAVTMPVRWLYELQDGTLGPASLGTKGNPIVGRIAFWTDDETSKININTAGVGSVWNVPRANSADDVAWGTTQPAVGEFNRYPGHPAMTSLLPVFAPSAASLSPADLLAMEQQLLGLTPRYSGGGSQFGTQSTTAGAVVPQNTDRLYASVDELCFGTGLTANGQRAPNPITPLQIEQAHFVLTAKSDAPETNVLGEPRVAIWPISDALTDSTHVTPADRAIAAAATLGPSDPAQPRCYFFQRHDPTKANDDFDNSTVPGLSNVTLFNELMARGGEAQPGYGTTFSQKYPSLQWKQILLEIADFIHGLNAVDAAAPALVAGTPSSVGAFQPFAPGDATGLGRAFVVPLTTVDSASGTTLRGFGRCPTLASLTLMIYVCGFGFDDGAADLDFDPLSVAAANAAWQNLTTNNRWQHVNSQLLRAFVVPCTFLPGCGFPEVSAACDVQISGLDKLTVSSTNATTGTKSGNFSFAASPHSQLLGTPLTTLAADRAWGGNDGPEVWRATGDALAGGSTTAAYPFAGTAYFKMPLGFSLSYTASSQTIKWTPPTGKAYPTLTCSGVTGLVVLLRDAQAHTLQTFTLNLSAFTVGNATVFLPNINQEDDHTDGSTPATSSATWMTDANAQVLPCYYMSLRNRLLATQRSRALMIQPGDVVRGIEAKLDLRVIAGLSSIPATLFQTSPNYTTSTAADSFNLRFADGTGALGSYGSFQSSPVESSGLDNTVAYPTSTLSTTGTDFSTGKSVPVTNAWFTAPSCSAPSGKKFVTMQPTHNVNGDWDTGPGFAPDGALLNLPDAGSSLDPSTAYQSLSGGQVGAMTRLAPNALIPSPVAFGSLPVGINPASPASSEPWRTLVFSPYPAADAAHPGFVSPPDYLLLDQFWMPTVQPYAISTCLATAGKINLNDQIAPFTYLHRNTALHGLLHDLRIPAIPSTTGLQYKSAGTPMSTIWQAVDENATIAQLESRFANGDAYLSESEICSVPLIPSGQTAATLDAFWNGAQGAGRLSGDNLRELPYAQLYSRLATRSNSYTVHMRVQVLRKLTADPGQGVWNEGVDQVAGDWRGSCEIERYLDPASAPPAAAASTAPGVTTAGGQVSPYRYLILNRSRFVP